MVGEWLKLGRACECERERVHVRVRHASLMAKRVVLGMPSGEAALKDIWHWNGSAGPVRCVMS